MELQERVTQLENVLSEIRDTIDLYVDEDYDETEEVDVYGISCGDIDQAYMAGEENGKTILANKILNILRWGNPNGPKVK